MGGRKQIPVTKVLFLFSPSAEMIQLYTAPYKLKAASRQARTASVQPRHMCGKLVISLTDIRSSRREIRHKREGRSSSDTGWFNVKPDRASANSTMISPCFTAALPTVFPLVLNLVQCALDPWRTHHRESFAKQTFLLFFFVSFLYCVPMSSAGQWVRSPGVR